VELAAEIITKYPTKDIYLVNSHDGLLQRCPIKAQKHAMEFLKNRGVKVLLGHRVLSLESKKKFFPTDKGELIPADLAFLCSGLKPNSEPLLDKFNDKVTPTQTPLPSLESKKPSSPFSSTSDLFTSPSALSRLTSNSSSFSSSSSSSSSSSENKSFSNPSEPSSPFPPPPPLLTRQSSIQLKKDGFFPPGISTGIADRGGFLYANEYLQLVGEENIFVAGDITASDEEKLAQTAERRAALVSKNVKRKMKGQKLIPYKGITKPLLISLGLYNGIFIYGTFVWIGLIPAVLKEIVEWKTIYRYIYRIPLPF